MLGDEAPFPVSPWLIASVLQVPVTFAFGLYRGGNRYDLVFEAFSDRIEVPRKNRNAALAEYVRRYAQRLQHHALRAPYNWFNFYDFWHPNDAMAAPDAQVSGVLETSGDAGGTAAGGLAARRVT
jgi:predicted LPLAT superfamily acyltransferase